MKTGERVYVETLGSTLKRGELVRIEGSPPSFLWVKWDGQPRPQRIMWPCYWLRFENENEDDCLY